MGFNIAAELEAVRFTPGKIKPGLVPGPIALSIAESVAKKKKPIAGLGDGTYRDGSGTTDTD